MQSLQRSADAGLQWADAGLQWADAGLQWPDVGGSVPYDVRALARSPVDPDHLLATARGGLYRSPDAGQTWHEVPTAIDPAPGTPGWRQISWCSNSDLHLLATVNRNLYRSVDAGLSRGFVRADTTGLQCRPPRGHR